MGFRTGDLDLFRGLSGRFLWEVVMMVTRLILTESLKAQRWAVPEGRNLNMCVKETSRDKAELLTELSHKNKVHRSWKQRQKSKGCWPGCVGMALGKTKLSWSRNHFREGYGAMLHQRDGDDRENPA